MPIDSLKHLGERLMAIYSEARAAGLHQVAYHALAAQHHVGEALRDFSMLELVENRAREHSDWLALHEPGHLLSPQSAATRGHHGVFEQLAAISAAARTRLKAENLTRK
jgi:hypothetical protein